MMLISRNILRVLVLGVSLATLSPINAASFDCSRASTTTEIMICQSPKLSELDNQLSETYRAAAKFEGVRESQSAWIKDRNRCQDEDCLIDAYETRIDALKGYLTGDFAQRLATPEPPAPSEPAKVPEKLDSPSASTPSDKPQAKVESPSEKPSESQEGDSDLVRGLVALGVVFLMFYLVYRIIRFFVKSGKNMLAYSAIRKKYTEASQIDGTGNDDSLYVSAHQKALNINPEKLQRTEVFFLGIPFADVTSSNFANWNGLRGELDEPSYNNAMQTYQLAKQQYDLAKDQAQRAKQPFYQSSPSKPSRSDFIRYYPASGTASVSCSHGVMQLVTTASVPSRSGEQIYLDLGDFKKIIDKVYEDILPKVISGALPRKDDSRVMSFESPDDDSVLSLVSGSVSSALRLEIDSQMSYSKDITFTYNSNMLSREEAAFVLVVVHSKLKSGKEHVSLHDYLSPSPMLESYKK